MNDWATRMTGGSRQTRTVTLHAYGADSAHHKELGRSPSAARDSVQITADYSVHTVYPRAATGNQSRSGPVHFRLGPRDAWQISMQPNPQCCLGHPPEIL